MRVLGLFVAVVAGVGCSRYDPSRENIAAMLREDAGYTRRLITFEIGSPDASLPEFRAFCDKAIEQRTERLIKIQALASSTSISSNFKEFINLQLEKENSLVRGKRRLFEEYIKVKTLRETYDRLNQQVAQSGRGANLEQAEAQLGRLQRMLALVTEIESAAAAAKDANVKWLQTLADFSKIEGDAVPVYSSAGIPIDRLEESLLATAVKTSNNIVEDVKKTQIPK
jgi:hypothetical protein